MGKMDLAQTACVEETAGVVEGETEEREEEKSTGVGSQHTPIFSLDKNQCYKSDSVSLLYT